MAMGIVDIFEVIDIDQQNGKERGFAGQRGRGFVKARLLASEVRASV
ncbi:hypothetical protein ACQKKX_19485 [Neorhizobium sp. NPDC001467]